MAVYGWDVVQKVATLSASVGTGTTTGGFSVPLGSAAMTVIVPALEGAATWKIQNLTPPGQDTEVWTDTYWLSDTTGAPVQLANFGGSNAIQISSEKLPAGVIRFVTSATQTTDKIFYVLFGQIQ